MKRLNDDTIAITNEEALQLSEILRNFLWREWDHHTNHSISTMGNEEGMRYMNTEAYDLANDLITM